MTAWVIRRARRPLHLLGIVLLLAGGIPTGVPIEAAPPERPLAAPSITAALGDQLTTDQDGDGKADPGDTLRSTVVIQNGGPDDAEDTTFSLPLDPNLRLQFGSLRATPLALPQTVTTTEDTPVALTLLGNDPDGDPLTFTLLTPPLNGTTGPISATGRVTATLTYTPAANFAGTDRLVFRVADATASDTATVTLQVLGLIDPPVVDLNGPASGTGFSTTVTEGSPPVGLTDPAATLIDVDSTSLVSLTATLLNPLDGAAEILSATVTGTIALAVTGTVLTLSGTDTITRYQQVLRSLSYRNSAENPTTTVRSIVILASDGQVSSSPVTATVSVIAVNDAPTVLPDSATTAEDTPVSIPVLANDSDLEGPLNPASLTILTPPISGTVSVTPISGTLIFTPALNATGLVTFSYQACDNGSPLPPLCGSAVVSVTVTAVNDAPVLDLNGPAAGTGFSASFTENGGPLAIVDTAATVIDVDSTTLISLTATLSPMPDGAAEVLSATVAGGISVAYAGGVLTLAGTETVANYQTVLRSITYRNTSEHPSPVSRTITFQASDGSAVSLPVTSTLTVIPVNDPPTVADDPTPTTAEDTPVTIDVLTNDSDLEGSLDPASVTILTPPSSGTATPNPLTGAVIFAPTADFSGTVTFVYQVCDSGSPLPALCGSATVTVTVTPQNDAPVLDLNGPAGGNGFSAAFTEGDAPAAIVDAAAATVVDVDSATLTSLSITIQNLLDGAAEVLTATVTGTSLTASYSGGVLTLTGPDTVANVQTVLRTVTYQNTSQNPSTTTRQIVFVANDGSASSLPVTATVSLTAVNDAPVVGPDSLTTLEDTPVTIDVLATDSDLEGPLNPASVQITTGPSSGTATVSPIDGRITVTPALSFNGTITLTYQACDTGSPLPALCGSAVVTVTVTAVNDAPSFTVAGDLAVLEDAGPQTVAGYASSILAGPPDESGQGLTFLLTVGTPALFSGVPTITLPSGALVFTPALNANGTSTLVIRLIDNGGTLNGGQDTSAPVTVTLTVTPVNDAPSFATGGNVTVVRDSGPYSAAWATSLSAGPPDEGGQSLAFTLLTITTTNPSLFAAGPGIDPSGVLTFTPAVSQTGVATVTMVLVDTGGTANGGQDTSSPVLLRITVRPPNFAPVALASSAMTNEDITVTLTLTGTDVEGAPLSFAIVTPPTGGTVGSFSIPVCAGLTCTATIVYTPTLNANGPDSFTYKVNDGQDDSPTATVSLTVNAVNDAPVNVLPVPQSVAEDSALALSGGSAFQVSDVDAGVAPVRVILTATNGTIGLTGLTPVAGANGTANLTVDGSLTALNSALTSLVFTPTANFSGTASLTITTNDLGNTGTGGALVDTDSLSITVTGVNDAPALTVPGAQPVNEDTNLAFTSANSNLITVADLDAGSLPVRLILTATTGVITVASTSGLTLGPGANGSASLTMQGTVTDVNAALNGLIFRGTLNATGSASLALTVNDLGNSGSGGPLIDTQLIAITLTAVNDAPVNTLPLAQSVVEDTVLTLSGGSAIQVSDIDAGGASVRVALVATNGTVALSGLSGLSLTGVNGSAALTVTGTLTDLNTALDGLVFTPTANFSGTASLAITTNDLGNTGLGGNLVDTDSLAITVTGVNDAPVNQVPGGQSVNEDTNLIFSGANLQISDIDAFDLPVRVILTATNGVITLSGTAGLTIGPGANGSANLTMQGTITNINTALNGLIFRGTAHFNDTRGTASLAISTDDLGNSGSGGPLIDTDTIAITVAAVNDAPSSQPKSYSAQTNMKVTIAAGSGLLVGATDPDTGDGGYSATFSVGTVGTSSPAGATITVTNATGAIEFDPPPGVTGAVVFTYTVCDSGNPGPGVCGLPATVTVTVSGPVIWFVDDTAPAGGTGRLSAPFNTLAGADAVDAANHRIFLYSGTYGTGLTMQSGEWLLGEGVIGSDFDTVMGTTPPAGTIPRPSINGTRPTVQGTVVLSNTVRVQGLNVSTTGAGVTAMRGTGITGVNVSEASLTASASAGLTLTNATVTVTLDAVTASGGTNGIALDTVAGTVTANGGTLTGAGTGPAFLVNAGTATVTYAGAINQTAANRAISISGGTGSVSHSGNIACSSSCTGLLVQNKTSGTVTFSGASKVFNTGANAAVTLSTNTGAIINFTNGGLDIDTTSGAGFSATGGGTVTVQGSGNTIDATVATGLNVTNTTIGSSRLTFQRVSSGASTGAGIILDNTGASGGLTVTGLDGGDADSFPDAGSGGTIANKTGANINTLSGGVISISGSDGVGIFVRNAISVSLNGMQLNDFSNYPILIHTLNGFTFADSVINGTNGNDSAVDEATIALYQLTGAALIARANIRGGVEDNVFVRNSSGTLNRLVIEGSTFGPVQPAAGDDAVKIEASGTAVINVTARNNTFTAARGDHFQANNIGNASMDVVFTDNTISNSAQANVVSGGGIVIVGSAGPSGNSITFNISNNTIRDSTGTAIQFGGGNAGNSGSGRIQNNVVGVQGVANSGSSGGGGIAAVVSGGGAYNILIDNNLVQQHNNHGVLTQVGQNLDNPTSVSFTVSNNTVRSPGTINNNFNGIHLNNGTVPTTDDFTTTFHMIGNKIESSGTGDTSPNNRDFRLRQRQSTTVVLPGYTGANNDDAAVVTFLQNQNNDLSIAGLPSGAASNTAPPGGSGGGFINGSVPPSPLRLERADSIGRLSPESGFRLVGSRLETSGSIPEAVVRTAIERLRASRMLPERTAAITDLEVVVRDLPADHLGESQGHRIALSPNAAGAGWFVDTTPEDDEEFRVTDSGALQSLTLVAREDSDAASGVDLLTVLLHELAHVHGVAHVAESGLMAETLRPGVRLLPTGSVAAARSSRETVSGQAVPPDGAPPLNSEVQTADIVSLVIGALPASKVITLTFESLVADPVVGGPSEIRNQGTVAGSHFGPVQTNPPGGSGPTRTPLDPNLPYLPPVAGKKIYLPLAFKPTTTVTGTGFVP